MASFGHMGEKCWKRANSPLEEIDCAIEDI